MNLPNAASQFEHLPFTIYPEQNLILVDVKGDLHFEDLVSHVPDFMQHPDFRSGMNLLYDMSNVTHIDGELDVLLSSAESLSDEEYIPVPAKTVFLISENQQIKRFLHGFCIMTRYSRVPHFIAESEEEAKDILQLPNELATQ